jgi:hypothetical protein
MQLPFTNGFYVSESLPMSHQECTNVYVGINPLGGVNPEYLVGTPGITQAATAGTLNRGIHVMKGVPYVVTDNTLYKVVESFINGDPVYTLSSIGSIAGSGRVSMADNGVQLLILSPGNEGYIYNRNTDTLVEITDGDFRASGNPTYVAYVDGFFVLTTDENKFIVSDLNDGTSYNALDFGTAESNPDDVVAPVVYRNQLFIAGGLTLEGFQNIGGADFPFQRTGVFIQKGVLSPFSLINTDSGFMFIGAGLNEAPSVWACDGSSVSKMATPAIDLLLRSITAAQLRQIYSWTYADKGSYFVGFALPDSTIVFDQLTKKWHERKSGQSAYRVNGIVTAFNKLFCTDRTSGNVGILDSSVFTEYGETIIRRFSTMPFINDMKSSFYPSIELTVESGTGSDTDPQIVMDVSRDGKTWEAPRPRGIGKAGQYERRAIWRRNGRMPRLAVMRFTFSDPFKLLVMALTAQVIPGEK